MDINLPVIQAPFLAYFPSWLFAYPFQLRAGCKFIFMQHDMNFMPLEPALVPSFLILPAPVIRIWQMCKLLNMR